MASKAVETIFSAVDRITPAFGSMSTGADRFAVAAKAAFRSVVPEASRLNDIIKGVTIGNLVTKGITTAVNAIRSNFSNAVTYASSLIEVQNIVDTVFGESSKTIDAFAKSAGKNFGLTELQAKKFSSTFGAMLSGIGIRGDAALGMSTGLAGLAGDLASFYNLSQEEAFSKLQSGLMGKTQPLQSIGIDVSATSMEEFAKAQGKVWKNMDRTNQTMLRYQYIMEKTKLAQGDYQKEIPSWAVSMRNATNAIQEMWGKLAQGLMPTLIKLADMVTATVQKISAWADAHRALIATRVEVFVAKVFNFVTALYKIVTKIGPAVLTAFVAFKTFSTVTAMINGVTVALKAMGVALTVATGPIGIVAAAIAALATGILMLNAASRRIRQERMNALGLNSEEEFREAVSLAREIEENDQRRRNAAASNLIRALGLNDDWRFREKNIYRIREEGLVEQYLRSNNQDVHTRNQILTSSRLLAEPVIDQTRAMEIAAEQVKASRPEEDDPVERQMEELLALMSAQNGLLGNIDENTGATSQKNLRWNKMGTEDFWETARLGV